MEGGRKGIRIESNEVGPIYLQEMVKVGN